MVLDEQNQLLYRSYSRHFSQVREKTCELLRGAEPWVRGQRVRAMVTGSAGLGMSTAAKVNFTQEVYATAEAVRTYLPGTDAVIELGGEDAKIIFFDGGAGRAYERLLRRRHRRVYRPDGDAAERQRRTRWTRSHDAL